MSAARGLFLSPNNPPSAAWPVKPGTARRDCTDEMPLLNRTDAHSLLSQRRSGDSAAVITQPRNRTVRKKRHSTPSLFSLLRRLNCPRRGKQLGLLFPADSPKAANSCSITSALSSSRPSPITSTWLWQQEELHEIRRIPRQFPYRLLTITLRLHRGAYKRNNTLK